MTNTTTPNAAGATQPVFPKMTQPGIPPAHGGRGHTLRKNIARSVRFGRLLPSGYGRTITAEMLIGGVL